MSTAPYTRLREVTLVTQDFSGTQKLLGNVFGLSSSRNGTSEPLGIHYSLLPLGHNFIEVVSPMRPDSGAGKFLERSGGRGAYIAFFDCEDIEKARTRMDKLGVRIIHRIDQEGFKALHLHPKDCGGAMIQLVHNVGGDASDGTYASAGSEWQKFVCTDRATALLGIELTSPSPQQLANRWAAILERPIGADASESLEIPLDNGFVRVVAANEDERINAVYVSVPNVQRVLSDAKQHDCRTEDNSVEICGVWFRLISAQ